MYTLGNHNEALATIHNAGHARCLHFHRTRSVLGSDTVSDPMEGPPRSGPLATIRSSAVVIRDGREGVVVATFTVTDTGGLRIEVAPGVVVDLPTEGRPCP